MFFCIKEDNMYTILSDKHYRFKRKRAFISPSSLAWGKFLSLCTCTRLFARANDAKIVLSQSCSVVNAKLTSFLTLNWKPLYRHDKYFKPVFFSVGLLLSHWSKTEFYTSKQTYTRTPGELVILCFSYFKIHISS